MTQRLLRHALVTLVAFFAACSEEDVTVETIDASIDVDAGTDLAADIDAAMPAGEQCGDAAPITLPDGVGSTRILSTTELAADDYDIGSCGDPSTTHGPDRVFVVRVAAGNRLIATVKGVPSDFDPAIYLIEGPAASCAAEPHTCLAASDIGPAGDYERVMYRNTSTTAVDIYVVVDGVHPAGGAFRLDVSVDAIPPTPPGDTCALAESVAFENGRATLRGTTSLFSGYNSDYAPHCTPLEEKGNDHVYAVTVPAGKRLEVVLTAKYSAALYLLKGPCSDGCLGGASGLPDEPAVITYDNTTVAPLYVAVVVDSIRELTGGQYQLDFQLSDVAVGN